MFNSVRRVLSRYATFSGRASRSEFWYWVLAIVIVMFIFRTIDATIIAPLLGFKPFQPQAGQPLSMLLTLALIIPNIALGVRRLHDINRSGWWTCIAFVPFIGFAVLLYFYIKPGDAAENKFGAPDPV